MRFCLFFAACSFLSILAGRSKVVSCFFEELVIRDREWSPYDDVTG